MRGSERPELDLRSLLERVEAAAPVAAVSVVAAELSSTVGARSVSFLMTDSNGHAVVRMSTRTFAMPSSRLSGLDHAETVPLAGTVYERVLRTQRVDVQLDGLTTRVLAPVTDRGDTLGLLEVVVPGDAEPSVVRDVEAAGHALAYIVIANRRHTDLFEWGQRSTPFSLAAEIQRRLLPSAYTCEAGQFTIAGWMEPASSVGGDTFDYSLDRHRLQVSITDAVGHDVAAALLATLLVGGLRNGRRRGLDLGDQALSASNALAANSAPGQFVTGQLLEVELATGTALVVNAGHPAPLRLRAGLVEELELQIDVPFGVEPGRPYRVQRLPLEPGDRIVLVTDGMQERNAASLDVAAALADSGHLHPREVVHALGTAVMTATGGELRDDATVVCLDWYGGPARDRVSDGGASSERASR
jgi:serine phosphatase RsbU (regulator of sigma subunit)